MRYFPKILFKAILTLSLFGILLMPASRVSAQIRCPVLPICAFQGIFGALVPACLNGALVTIFAPEPIVVIFPYVPEPVFSLLPIFKLWGPIPTATTEGNFHLGGVCLVKVTGGTIAIPLLGTLMQIGTTAGPTSFVPVP